MSFCQVHGFSAKFVACLPSWVQSVQSFCQVRGSFCQVRGTELAKNCQLETIGNFLPTQSHSVQKPRIPARTCAMAPSWQFFANGFVLAESTKLGRKAMNMAEANQESRNGGSLIPRGAKNSSRHLHQLGPDSYDSLNLIGNAPMVVQCGYE